MGIAVSLHAPDCKTSSSSIGSSGMGLAQGSGIAYSDASRPRERKILLNMQPANLQPWGCLGSLDAPEEAHCSVQGQPLPGVYEVKKNSEVTLLKEQTMGNTLLSQ